MFQNRYKKEGKTMKKTRAILAVLLWVFGTVISSPLNSRAAVLQPYFWDHIPLMSLNLNVNDPADQAGQIDPWNNEALNDQWGDSWLGNGTQIPGAAFIFNYDFVDQNECDRSTDDSNTVEWNNFTATHTGLMTKCNDTHGSNTLAVTFTTFYTKSGKASNSDVLFNRNVQWTTANPGSTSGSPFNFRSVATHEFGHVLGLNHEDSTLAVMNSIYHANPNRLHAD